MIHPHHLPHLERMQPYYRRRMLMLGRQGSAVPGFATARAYFGQWVDGGYQDLDLDDGDLKLDLNNEIGLTQTHRTVFNLGTIEHVWNAHNAWANALRAVKLGGHFLSHSPAEGWAKGGKHHGLHMTSPVAIKAFISKNGFEILDTWTSAWKTQGTVFWLVATKKRHIDDLAGFLPAEQIYMAGEKKQVR